MKARAAVSRIFHTGVAPSERRGGSLERLLVWSLAWLASGSTEGEDEVVDKQVNRDAHVVESGGEPDDSFHPTDDQGSADTLMEDDEGRSEKSSMQVW